VDTKLRVHFYELMHRVGHDLQSDELSLIFRCICRMTCSQGFAIGPTSTGRRYFGVQTQWNLRLYTTLWFDL